MTSFLAMTVTWPRPPDTGGGGYGQLAHVILGGSPDKKIVISAQDLLLHAERCMRHEDVVKKILLAGLNRTLNECLWDSFAELIEEMELWKWDDATGDFWSRLAKALQQTTSQSRGQSSGTAD